MSFRASVLTLYPEMFPGALGLSLAGSEVTLQDIEADKYHGRVVADVGGPGADLAEALRRSGLVRDYAGGRRMPWCPDASQMNGR